MLKRVWWLVHNQPDIDSTKKIDLKMNLFFETLATRCREQEIQFSVKDMIYFEACYILYKRTKESRLSINTEMTYDPTEADIESLEPPHKWKKMSSTLKKDKINMAKDKAYKILTELKNAKKSFSP